MEVSRKVMRRAAELLDAGVSFALCTVIGARGSVPGKAGAKMIVLRDGSQFGTVGGAGLEEKVKDLGRRCIELIGPCDVLRPWSWDEEGSHVQAEVGWMVLEETTMAVLDHGLVERIMPWPALGVELFNRGTRRAHHLAVALAISHHQRVDDRLLLTLWHLAERWGKVTPAGIVVPLPLGHQRLADLVGAHRPSVTSALGELTRGGAISRRDDGVWVLHGAPPEELRHHKLANVPT